MNIVVLAKTVPDLAEELEVADNGTELDDEYLSWVINEYDDHALEEALHLKEAAGGNVTVLALGTEAAEDVLYTCLAKGADEVVKVGKFERHVDSHTAARAFATALGDMPHDLILTGVQAVTDLDGQVGPLVATHLGLPHVSVVTHIALDDGNKTATVHQEYAGGVFAEMDVDLPAVLGVQAAREVPRYAPVSRVRQLMKSATIETVDVEAGTGSGVTVKRMFVPEGGGHAEMIEGDAEAVAERLVTLLGDRGLLSS